MFGSTATVAAEDMVPDSKGVTNSNRSELDCVDGSVRELGGSTLRKRWREWARMLNSVGEGGGCRRHRSRLSTGVEGLARKQIRLC